MLNKIYRTLLKEYGPQGWWPVTRKGALHPAYDGGAKNERQMFEVIVGAILTQNTSWKNVEKAICSLNKEKALDIEEIRNIEQEKLAELIRSAGYYNQKALKLKAIAEFLHKNPLKKLKNADTGALRKLFLSIKGVGPETADSILLYAFNRPVFVVDAYTKRIFFRLGFFNEKTGYDEVQGFFHENLKKDAKMFSEFHALIVEHGKRHCSKKERCEGCSLHIDCKIEKKKSP